MLLLFVQNKLSAAIEIDQLPITMVFEEASAHIPVLCLRTKEQLPLHFSVQNRDSTSNPYKCQREKRERCPYKCQRETAQCTSSKFPYRIGYWPRVPYRVDHVALKHQESLSFDLSRLIQIPLIHTCSDTVLPTTSDVVLVSAERTRSASTVSIFASHRAHKGVSSKWIGIEPTGSTGVICREVT